MEVNPELHYISSHFFAQSPYATQIESHVGNAMHLIPHLDHGIDMVWLDAGKKDYAAYFDILLPKMRPGGILMADNVLWDGKVAGDSDDAVTQALRLFNQQVRNDDRVEQVILPLRDGITIVRKK
jgi:predicted O-methyltransferase YrrM